MARVADSARPTLDLGTLEFDALETETVYDGRFSDPLAMVPVELRTLIDRLYAAGNESLAVYVPQSSTVQAQELARLSKVYGANRPEGRITVIPVLTDDAHNVSNSGRIVRIRTKVFTPRARKGAAEGAKNTK